MAIKLLGVDVSRWQGTINWTKVKSSGVKFAILKAGGSDDGFYTDRNFETYYKGATSAGIPVGAYYFVGPKCKDRDSGIADANRFLEIIKGKQFAYPVYIDFEAPSTANKAGNTDACIGFCETMEKAGYYCGIYSSAVSGFQDRLDDSRLQAYDHWVADYRGSCGYKGDYGMWQYTSEGKVSGINFLFKVNVDCDWCYKDYPTIMKENGLNGFTKTAESAPVTPAPVPTPAKPEPVADELTGKKITLKDAALYISSSAKSKTNTVSGTYYVWSKDIVNNRIRITNTKANVGKDGKVTGWITASYATKTTTSTKVSYTAGSAFKLNRVDVYTSASATKASGILTGTYYVYDGKLTNGRLRVTNTKANVGKTPVSTYVTGWVKKTDLK